MRNQFLGILFCLLAYSAPRSLTQPSLPDRVFNVRDFGAAGVKKDNVQASIQKAIDACSQAGGGMVYFPPGEYTSGTIHLRSHVRLYVEAGATIFSVKDKSAFDKDALIFGEDLENVTLEGRGTIDGQGEYEWRLNDIDDRFIRDNQLLMEATGKPLMRSFPKKDGFGKLVLLLRCKDIRITGLSLIRSPSWTIHPYGCERMVIDGVYIRSSLKDGVWADGIDPDGCKDLRVSNCTIETGDDAIVFYSMNWFGPPLPCENITVTNCRLSSASSALKFCDGNMNCVRNVTVDNCVITDSNRGIAFMVFDGGYVSNVVISNLTIECRRHDWFWWGDGDPFHFNIKRRSEVHPQVKFDKEPPAGSIRNVLIQNVIAHGKGSSVINGHPDSWLDGITFENIKLFLSSDPSAPYDKAVHGFKFQRARNLRLRNVEVTWEKPELKKWGSALYLEDIQGLEIDGFRGKQAWPGAESPAIQLNRVREAMIRACSPLPGTETFLRIAGASTRDIALFGNDFRRAQHPYTIGAEVQKAEIRELNNINR